jgi:hypothetical protein
MRPGSELQGSEWIEYHVCKLEILSEFVKQMARLSSYLGTGNSLDDFVCLHLLLPLAITFYGDRTVLNIEFPRSGAQPLIDFHFVIDNWLPRPFI